MSDTRRWVDPYWVWLYKNPQARLKWRGSHLDKYGSMKHMQHDRNKKTRYKSQKKLIVFCRDITKLALEELYEQVKTRPFKTSLAKGTQGRYKG